MTMMRRCPWSLRWMTAFALCLLGALRVQAAPDTLKFALLTGSETYLQKYEYYNGALGGVGKQAWSADFTGFAPASGRKIVLAFEARFDSDRDAIGSTNGLLAFLDEQPLEIVKNRLVALDAADPTRLTGAVRLLNKPAIVPGIDYWNTPNVGWRLVYGTNWNGEVSGYGPSAYRYELDITDLVKPGVRHALTLRHLGSNFNVIRLRNVQILERDGISPLPTATGWKIAGTRPASALTFDSTGAIRLRVTTSAGAQNLYVNSYYGAPGTPTGRYWRLGPAPAAGYAAHLGGKAVSPPTITSNPDGSKSFVVAGRYRVTRRVSLGSGHALVTDTLQNLTGEYVAVPFTHELTSPGSRTTNRLDTVIVGGMQNPLLEYIGQPGRPTVFFPLGVTSALLTCELQGDPPLGVGDISDQVRLQTYQYCRPDNKGGGLRDERLVLYPNSTRQYRWSVYALPGQDEFDYINRLRADWQTPLVTVPGPVCWSEATYLASSISTANADLRAWAERNKPFAIVTGGGWNYPGDATSPKPYAFGPGVNAPYFKSYAPPSSEFPDTDPYRLRIRKAADRIHETLSRAQIPGLPADVRFYVYNDFYISGPLKSSPADTLFLDDSALADSHIVNADGSRYGYGADNGITLTGGIFPYDDLFRLYAEKPTDPTGFNAYGYEFIREMWDQLSGANDGQNVALHADGFFWDTFNGIQGFPQKRLGFAPPGDPLTFNYGDGVTGVVNPQTFAVTNASVTYPVWYANVLSRNLLASFHGIANGTPITTLQQLQYGMCFYVGETFAVAEARWQQQLTTPLSYHDFGFTMEDLRYSLDWGLLRINSWYGETDSDVIGRLYPFTALDLHRGWVRGVERIVTRISNADASETTRLAGTPPYGWNGSFRYRVYKYNRDRSLVSASPPVLTASASSGVLVSVPPGGIAIIERVL